ncbi:solute carrier family 2, facilitated glucose transporter member 6 isoform X2 [Hydra vulgaris]|uniref:solute carrier family 2, facilitated glucose transporter member 6 isoform X2 n=1 Tax=Hydra vulgaris TaxID=6087 RepID=UPI0032E9D049
MDRQLESDSLLPREKEKTATTLLAVSIASFLSVSFGFNLLFFNPFTLKNNQWHYSSHILFGIAASIGSLFSGICIDKIGRKSTILMISTIYFFGYVVLIFGSPKLQNSADFANLFTFFGCFYCGIGFGMTSLAVPVYVAEVSSPRLRGTMGAITHYAIVLGIFVYYLTADANNENINYYFFALIGLVLVLFNILIICMPESPRWLLADNQRDKAFKNQFWLLGIKSEAEDECNQIEINLAHQHTASINDFRSPGLFRPLLIGIHKISRRGLLLFGSTVLFIWSICFYVYYLSQRKVDVKTRVAYFFIYDIIFTFTWGPLPWIIVSEIFPPRARGLLGGILRSLIWLVIIPLETMFKLPYFASYVNFLCITVIVFFLSIFFIYYYVPETKNLSLEEIEHYYTMNRGFRNYLF